MIRVLTRRRKERWAPAAGRYAQVARVSNQGRVRVRKGNKFVGVRQHTNPNGYPAVYVWHPGTGNMLSVRVCDLMERVRWT